jgi:hypothetical protein
MVGTLEKVKNSPDLLVESWMLEMKKVSLSARMLYSLFVSLSHKHGFAWPSQRFLAERLGVSQRTINSLVGQLKKAGMIIVDGPTLTRSTCVYTPKRLPPARPHQTDAPSKPHFAGVSRRDEKTLRTTDNTNKLGVGLREKNPLNPPQVGEVRTPPSSIDFRLGEFATCYKAWPLQQNRKGSLRTWKRLARNGELPIPGKILQTIEYFKIEDAYWKRDKVPALGRWLRNHRWEDQPHIISPSSPPAQVPVSSGSPNPEMQARGQLVLVRLGIETGKPDNGIDITTQSIIAGHGGFHDLRMLPVREVGFVLSGFVKDYVALLNSPKPPKQETPEKNGTSDKILVPQGRKGWPKISASTLQRSKEIANGILIQIGMNHA